MTAKKDSGKTAYIVLRDHPAAGQAGDTVELTDEEAETLVRDGMVTPKET